MAFIDVDYLRRHPVGVKIQNVDLDIVQENIDDATQYVKDYLDREIEIKPYTERIVGPGGYTLILDEYPIVSLVDVSYDGYPNDVGTHALTDFLIHAEAGMLEWIDKRNVWRTDRVYTVQYTAGYATIPGPIKRATALQTLQLMRSLGTTLGVQSPDFPEIVPFADELIVNLLEKYKRKRIS